MTSPSETSPLLGAHHSEDVPRDLLTDGEPESRSLLYKVLHPTQRQRVTVGIFLGIFLIELAANSSMPAVNSISEMLVCRDVYGESVIGDGGLFSLRGSGDPRCKSPDVQQRLASLRGTVTAFECIPALIFAVPYGVLADSIGRRLVIIAAWVGLVLQMAWYLIAFGGTALGILPLWSVFLTLFWGCIGAFPSVGPAMMYTALADVTPQAERATAYFYLMSFFLLAELVSNPLGGILLLWIGDFLTLTLGVFLAILSTLVVASIPETLNFDKELDRVVTPTPVPALENVEETVPVAPKTRQEHLAAAWNQTVHLIKTEVSATAIHMLKNKPLMLLMIPFCLVILGRFVQELLLQFATKRFDWSWSQASFLLTIRSSTNLILCLVVLPFLSKLLVRRFHIHPLVKDLWIARVSGSLLCVGALLIAFAITPAMMSGALFVFSLGGGFSPVLRSLINAYVESHHQAMLQTLLGLLEMGGLLVAAPVLYGSLHRGLAMGGAWTGLPFIIAAAMIFTGVTIICIFRLPQEKLRAADATEAEVDV